MGLFITVWIIDNSLDVKIKIITEKKRLLNVSIKGNCFIVQNVCLPNCIDFHVLNSCKLIQDVEPEGIILTEGRNKLLLICV